MLSAQGFSKLRWMLGHEAWVFHVLANAVAVPSITPLIALKSSVWILLKFPQRPVEEQWKVCTAHTRQKTLRRSYLHSLTTRLVFENRIQSHKHLHDGCDLDFNQDTKLCLHDDEERWRSEHGDVSCRWKTEGSLSEWGRVPETDSHDMVLLGFLSELLQILRWSNANLYQNELEVLPFACSCELLTSFVASALSIWRTLLPRE